MLQQVLRWMPSLATGTDAEAHAFVSSLQTAHQEVIQSIPASRAGNGRQYIPRFVEMISNFQLVRANKHRDDGVHQTLEDTLDFANSA